jgi:hypothetical protein
VEQHFGDKGINEDKLRNQRETKFKKEQTKLVRAKEIKQLR